jgi:hypothetical protein
MTDTWLDELEARAPGPVAAYRYIEVGKFLTVRREIRRRMSTGAAAAIVPQLAALAEALDEIVARLPVAAFHEPGGESDWTVAETIGHDAHARGGLALAGALAASGRWPADAPAVVPGVPGAAGATREALRQRIAASQRVIERAAQRIAGHETEPCPLEHPWVGRLRCGEWLLFAGVHDLLHLEQLHELGARFAR